MINKKRCLALVLALLLSTTSFCSIGAAQSKVIETQGEYLLGDGETPVIAKQGALLDAKRMAVEKAGTFLESFSEVVNNELTKDQVRALASGILEVTVLDDGRRVNDKTITFWVKIKALVNSDLISDVNARGRMAVIVEGYRQVEDEYARLQAENTALKEKLKVAEGSQKQEILTQLVASEQEYDAASSLEAGYQAYVKGSYTKAVELYSKALVSSPNNYLVLTSRGAAYKAQGLLTEALADYNQAIANKPDYAPVYNNRGNIYATQGKLNEAIADYTQALTCDSQYVNAYYNRGLAYYQLGQSREAIADYNQVLTINPQDGQAYCDRGNAYAATSQMDLALADYNQAVKRMPTNSDCYFNRGIVYQQQGLNAQALADYNKATQLNPRHAYAWYRKGMVLAKQGLNADAKIAYNQFIQTANAGDPYIVKAQQQIARL